MPSESKDAIAQEARRANRAEKMHAARMKDKTDYPATRKMQFAARDHIGCSGWFYWDWKGGFYPEALPTNQWFPHYQKHFTTVELNAPFYGWPTVATVKSWRRQVEGTDFIYTIKVNELITHIKQFKGTKQLIRDFGYIADVLGPHMGCFLFQLPPSFHYTPARLQAIVSQLDPKRRNAVEFRHASWWCEEVYTAFRAHRIIFCACSGPKLPDALIQTTDEIYVRFHGTEKWYRHLYSLDDMRAWQEKIAACDATQRWIYFNNDYDEHAITNARQLKKLLKAAE